MILTQYTVQVHKTHTYGMNATFKKCKTLGCWHHGSLAITDGFHNSQGSWNQHRSRVISFNDCFTLEGGKSDEWRHYYGCDHSGSYRRTDMWSSANINTSFGNHIRFFRATHTAASVLCGSLWSDVIWRDLWPFRGSITMFALASWSWKRGTFFLKGVTVKWEREHWGLKVRVSRVLKWHRQYGSYREKMLK